MTTKAQNILWQYSEEWQRQWGIFTPAVTGEDDGWSDDDREVLADGFVPSLNKLEAVNRLSSIAGGGTESLGPGSKERKSVLETVALAVGLPDDFVARSKTELAKQLAQELGATWTAECQSTGQTLTLAGLNALLQGAERRLSRRPHPARPDEEAHMIAGVLEPILQARPYWDLRTAVTEMREESSTQWRQSEWVGWYFEHIGLSRCFGELEGSPKVSPTTVFDFSRSNVWDFKVHSDHSKSAPLNDQVAIRWALEQGGLGFVILVGRAEFEDWGKPWLDAQKAADPGKNKRKDAAEPRTTRRIKSAFTPTQLDFYFFPHQRAWDGAVEEGMVTDFQDGWKQNDQTTERAIKYKLNLQKAKASRFLLLSLTLAA